MQTASIAPVRVYGSSIAHFICRKMSFHVDVRMIDAYQ